MEYDLFFLFRGAGCEISFGDKRVVEAIVNAEAPEGCRFRDPIRTAIQSGVFRAT